jgi:4-amino-4-deoxy-L-arabinose transferase-like glycosyltransferase
LRLIWAVRYMRTPAYFVGGDPFGYLSYARSVVDGHGYLGVLTHKETAFQPPGWPFALVVAFFVVDHLHLPVSDAIVASLLNVAFGTGTIVLTAAIARRLAGRRVALIAAAIVALWPNLVYYSSTGALEPMFTFLVLLVCWLVLRSGWPSQSLSWRRAIGIGVVLGITLLVRPFAIVVLVALAVATITARGRETRARRVREVAAIGLVALFTLIPWTVRNAMQLHGFVPVATNLGETLCIGHQPGATGGLIPNSDYCVHGYHVAQLMTPHDEILRSAHATRAALHYVKQHPADEIALLPRKLYYLMRSDHEGLTIASSTGYYKMFRGSYQRVLVDLGDTWFFAMCALALGSVVGVWRHRRDAATVLLVLTAVGLLAIPLGLYGIERFHVPLAPFIAMGAAYSLDRVVRRVRRTSRPRVEGVVQTAAVA